jgi:ADP-ribose pyrophosphatase
MTRNDEPAAARPEAADPHLTESPLHGETVFHGRLLHVCRDTVRLPDGGEATREYVRHPGAVLVVGLLDDPDTGAGARVVVERQYRYPVRQVMLELPAGKIDPREPPWACAVRELAEETGYRARQWARAGLIHPCVGYSDEIIEIWFARHLTAGPARLDPGEFLDVGTASLAELDAALASGQLTDGKSVAALLWLHRLHRGEWHPDWQAAPVATLADEPHPPA